MVDLDCPVENFNSSGLVRARKEHTCEECRKTIKPGDRYENVRGKCEGDWFSAKTCSTCAAIRNVLFCYGWEYGNIWPEIVEQVFPEMLRVGPYDCAAKIEDDVARTELLRRFNEYAEENRDE